jgi:adhesin/invasin
MKRRKSLMIVFMLLWGMFFISGCGDGIPEGTLYTTGATVTLTPDTAGLAGLSAGQTCILTATLMDKSTTPVPLSGQVIAFSIVDNQSGATLAYSNGGRTDSVGKAYVVYTAGRLQPGLNIRDTVQANINDFSGFVTITRKGGGGGTAGFQISVAAAPTTVPAGGDQSVITATVTNADNEAVSGQTVSFAFLTNESGATLSASSAVTDGGGKAVVTYQAGNNNPTFAVQDTIRAGITGSAGAVVITRTLGRAPTTYSIEVTANPTPLLVIGGGSSVVTAEVTGPSMSGVTVNFTTTAGAVSPSSATTDFSGKAQTVFTVGAGVTKTTAGVVTASITVDGNTYSASAIITYP